MSLFFKKIAVVDKLPEIGKYVTTIDTLGEHRVYCRQENNMWKMRDASGKDSPNDNLPIVYWLEELEESKEFEIVSRTMMKYLAEHKNPYAYAIVNSTSSQLLEALKGTGLILDYVKN